MRLTSATIEPRQFASNNDVRIERIGNDIAVFFCGNRLPIAKRNLTLITTALDSDRTAFLLAAIKLIRKRIVRADVIELRCGLVIPRTPGLTAVYSDDRALVRTKKNELSELFNCGRYFDKVVRENGQLKFAAKVAVFDSELIPNSLIYPV